MMVYSGVLTAVTLGVIPLLSPFTFIASPAIKAQLRKAAEKNAVNRPCWLNPSVVFKQSKLRTLKTQCDGVGSVVTPS